MKLIQRYESITDRPSAAFSLNKHRISPERTARPDATSLASLSLQSAARAIVQATQLSSTGVPMDLDAIAFWAHGVCARAALVAIKYKMSGVEVLKSYLGFFEQRYKLYGQKIVPSL